jgi:hypothetical protein
MCVYAQNQPESEYRHPCRQQGDGYGGDGTSAGPVVTMAVVVATMATAGAAGGGYGI